ncbi:hypothetical protein RM572_11230 [Streptomyces sp. DSM 42041]|uniref:Uncharacterized protein n=1 Tax=Streptomyces hazeniae TaxID=3075538 RepID=A0ABU2NRG7_9ACTN|nr:hypothetical protein [Streptomyces sp. DSM 42041]MDT0379339.1 hypothetical protein [Streptomyces sp. DSM 42041]
MATNDTATTEPVEETELTTMNRHTPISPVELRPDADAPRTPADPPEQAATSAAKPGKPGTRPQKNRHTPAEPAD